ncbi:MAG: aldehyde dehydrogenase family protein [Sphingomonadales bacterium]|nr:MAG: aldehyde dehydrogenase family protein [Sphingomonadales bacterium]
MTIPFTKFDGVYIGNEWVTAADTDPVINPATEEVIGLAPVATVAQADQAIAAARDAFDKGSWPRMSRKERAAVMQRMLDALIARKAQIRALLIAEIGCAQYMIDLVQIGACLEHFQKTIDHSLNDDSYHLPIEAAPNPVNPDAPRTLGSAIVVREPIGVVSAITAYNFPFFLCLSKIVPALLTGNTMVLKPSPFTPFSALLFGEVANEIGLPRGVLNIVTGGGDVGGLITTDDRVDMVTFTGSEGVGSAIMQQAAKTLKRVHLELGGKSAMIVRSDANIMAAAQAAVGSISVNAGQGCALMTRFLVHNDIRAAFAATCAAVAPHFKVGNPADPSVLMGPLIRDTQRARVESLVASGVASGAELIVGGGRTAGLDKGYFHDITIFDNVDNKSEIAQEEVFGPVGVIIGFDTDEEAIDIANDSRFGLSGSIMSADAATAFDIAGRIRTGSMHINGGMGKMAYGPLGGYKRSGLGREFGPEWLKEYTQEKSIYYPVGYPKAV